MRLTVHRIPWSTNVVIAFPFLKYGARIEPGDPDDFPHVLHRKLALGGAHPRFAAWIARVDARPRA